MPRLAVASVDSVHFEARWKTVIKVICVWIGSGCFLVNWRRLLVFVAWLVCNRSINCLWRKLKQFFFSVLVSQYQYFAYLQLSIIVYIFIHTHTNAYTYTHTHKRTHMRTHTLIMKQNEKSTTDLYYIVTEYIKFM